MALRKSKEGVVPRGRPFNVDVDRRQPGRDEPLKTDQRKALRYRLVNDVRFHRSQYRTVASQIILALQAAAQLTWVDAKAPKKTKTGEKRKRMEPGTEKVKTFLDYIIRCNFDDAVVEAALSFLGRTGKKREYPLRQYLRDNVFKEGEHWSDACDHCLNYVQETLKRKCPDLNGMPFHKAISLGILEPPKFKQAGIRFRPRLVKVTANTVSVHWSPEIGWVQFYFPRKGKGYFDGLRYEILNNIRDGVWKMNTAEVQEYKGSLSIKISYDLPIRKQEVDPNKVLAVTFSMDDDNIEHFISGQVLEDEGYTTKRFEDFRREEFSALAAVDQVKSLEATKVKWKKHMQACGYKHARNPGQGILKARKRYAGNLERNTKKRRYSVRTWNERWVHRLIAEAVRLHCGKIRLFEFPKVSPKERKKRKPLFDGLAPEHLEQLGVPKRLVPAVLGVLTEAKLKKDVFPDLSGETQDEINILLNEKDSEIRPTASKLFGQPWQWGHFESHLDTKCAESGIKMEISEHVVKTLETVTV